MRRFLILLILLIPQVPHSVGDVSEWDVLQPMTVPRTEVAVVSLSQPSRILDKTEDIVPQDEWRERDNMTSSRHGFGSAAVDGRIYVIGGGQFPGASFSAINEGVAPSLSATTRSLSMTKFFDLGSPVGLAWDGGRFIASWRDDGTSELVTITRNGTISPFSESFIGGHEVYIEASPGLGGFKNDSLFVSTYFDNIIEINANGDILRNVSRPYPFDPVVFFTFDTVGTWNFSMLATTEDGSVWTIDHEGNHNRIIVLGQRTWLEGITVAPRDFGEIGGNIILAVEEGEKVLALSPSDGHSVIEVASFPNELPEKIEVIPSSKDLFISLVDRHEIVMIDRDQLEEYVGDLLLITEGRNNTFGTINIIRPSENEFEVITVFKEFNMHFEDAIFVDLDETNSVGENEIIGPEMGNNERPISSGQSLYDQAFSISLAVIAVFSLLIVIVLRKRWK